MWERYLAAVKPVCSLAALGSFSMAIYPKPYAPQICKCYIIFKEYYTNPKTASQLGISDRILSAARYAGTLIASPNTWKYNWLYRKPNNSCKPHQIKIVRIFSSLKQPTSLTKQLF